MAGYKPKKKRFADDPIGYIHIDIAEVRTKQGKLYLFVAIDRTSKLAFAKLEAEANRCTASDFLRELDAFVPYKIHTVLTDNGVQFCHAPRNRSGPTALYSRHMFDRVCYEHGIEHRLTKPNHPWTNGQVERMNRTIKDATVKRYHYETHEQLRAHLQLFVDAYNHARQLKTLRGLTPYEHVLQVWTKEPERFRLDPSHHIPGPYTFRETQHKGILKGDGSVGAGRHPRRGLSRGAPEGNLPGWNPHQFCAPCLRAPFPVPWSPGYCRPSPRRLHSCSEPMAWAASDPKGGTSISDRYLYGNHLSRRRVIIKRL